MLTTAFMQVLDMTIAASIVIVAVIAARLLLKRAPKIFSYALWAIVLFRLLCPFSLESQVSVIPEIVPVSQSYELAGEPISILGASEAAYQAVGDALNGGLGVQHIRTTEQTEDGMTRIVTSDWWDVWILFGQYVWVAGIAFMALRSTTAYLKLRRQLVGTIQLQDNVYLADGIETPFVMGLVQPRIYLPSSLDERERSYILFHEQHHIKRFDHITRALAFVALCIHWFNPLVWAAFALSGKDMEMSCDEAVMRKMGAEIRADYATSLLGFATGRRLIVGTPLAFGEGDTRSRIENLARWKKPAIWVVVAAVAMCVAATLMLATNPKDQSEELFPGYYQVEEIIYKNAWYAELDFLSEEDLPQVNLSAAGLLLLSNGSEWLNAGMMEETTLKKGNFDEYFYGVTYESSPGALRRSTTEAYLTITVPTAANDIAALAQVEGLGEHGQLIFYAFSTQDGSAYLACGSWDEEALSDPASDDSEFLWVAKLAKTENLAEPEYSRTSSAQSFDEAISAAILEHYRIRSSLDESGSSGPWPDGFIHVESHVLLANETAISTPLAGQDNRVTEETAYLLVLHEKYSTSGGVLEPRGGSYIPTAIAFNVDEYGAFSLKEYWEPRDGADNASDVRAKFPGSSAEEALTGQGRYVDALEAENRSKAVAIFESEGGIDARITTLLDEICSSPSPSSAPEDCIAAHGSEFAELIGYGEFTLRYCFSQFLEGGQTDLRGRVMAVACQEVATSWGEAILMIDSGPPLNGQEWFDELRAHVERLAEQYGAEELEKHYPASWLLLQMTA